MLSGDILIFSSGIDVFCVTYLRKFFRNLITNIFCGFILFFSRTKGAVVHNYLFILRFNNKLGCNN